MKITKLLLVMIAALGLAFSLPAAEKKSPPKKPASTTEKAEKKAPASKLLDINTASEKELKELPGIGDAYAAKIVQNRPYRAKNELVQKKIIPQATYEKIRDMIVARQRK